MADERTSNQPVVLHLGLDLGSVSVKAAVLDAHGRVQRTWYQRHHGQPIPTALRLLTAVAEAFGWPDQEFRSWPGHVAVTGTAGRLLADLLGAAFVNEIVAQSTAVHHLCPSVRTLIEMGGEDSKLILFQAGADGRVQIDDFAMNSVCAAGTGSFLDQQASRLGLPIDEFGRLALRSQTPPRVAGRCSVFAKSDMIHLQQQATPDYDIVAGLCLGLARNFKSGVGKGMEFPRPVAFCGGVAANQGVVRAFEQVLELKPGELIVPPEHAVTGAIGAALAQWLEEPARSQSSLAGLGALRDHLRAAVSDDERLPPLPPPRALCRRAPQGDKVPRRGADGRVRAYLGVDVGSISTNVVVMDDAYRVLSKAYLMTAGRPIEAVRQGLRQVWQEVAGQVEIWGAGTTGSGRYLTGDMIGADIVVNEITAQATAAVHIDPQVDTIFEIGGQDSKYISLRDGVVVDFEMNHACAAGTGSFLEEQAERLGISIKEEFGRLALAARSPVRLGERCTVFMESDLQNYLQKGADRQDLVAGLCYSIVSNYLNRVVGKRRLGRRIFFQGGVAFNQGVVAAFEQVTGQPIHVPEHHEVTGAIGMAILAKRHADAQPAGYRSRFRGFELADRAYQIETFECPHCANHCEIKKVTFEGQDPIHYGSRCDRYNLRQESPEDESLPDLFAERHRWLTARLAQEREPGSRGTVGIPLALANYQLLPFWAAFFRALGYTPIGSGRSTKSIIRRGVELVTSQACFPVKVAHGHVAELLDRGVDVLWLPSVVAMSDEGAGANNNHLCPYVQTIPYQVEGALDLDRPGLRVLKPAVRFQEGPRQLARDLAAVARPLGVSRARIRRAVRLAWAAQADFEEACRRRGREVLDALPEGQRAVVIVSRPYNGGDRGINLDVPGKLRRKGVLPIPMDFLDLRPDPRHPAWENMYWKYGQKILRAAQIISQSPRLHAIYLTNFSCGPDSFLVTFFKRVLGQRPCLVLEIDEHSADAGIVTRLEAFLDSLKNAPVRGDGRLNGRYLPPSRIDPQRTLYIPNMADGAHAMAAALRRVGQPAEVMPASTEESLELGRKVCSGKECLPCLVTAGDMLRILQTRAADRRHLAFFMPAGDGPCRFGQYHCLHRVILDERGYGDVPVVSPNQGNSFYRDFTRFKRDPTRDAWRGIVAIDLLQKVRLKVRPYEIHRGQTDAVYQRLVQEVAAWVEAGRDLRPLMARAARRLAAIPRDTSPPRPRIGVVGEIYVRSHEFSNNHLLRRLEALGAETALASFGEWIYYTNVTRAAATRRRRDAANWARNALKDWWQHRTERRLAAPLEEVFGPLTEPPISHLLDLADPYIHRSFEGEAVLSIGKLLEYYEEGYSGVIVVGPFTCMPSMVVASQIRRLRARLGSFPVLLILYDGQRAASIQARLEALMHQVRQYHAKQQAGSEHHPARSVH